jgi:hypothetical protein
VSKYTILTRITSEHNEFWSAELSADGRSYTGVVLYGGIGQSARRHDYTSTLEVRQKMQEKIRNGYIVVANEHSDYNPTQEMIARISAGNVVRDMETPRESPVQRAETRIRRARTTPQRVRHVSSSGIPIYKTSRDGLIKQYNPEYVRKTPTTQSAREPYLFYNKEGLRQSNTLNEKARKFYNEVPASMVIKKPLFGYNREDIFGQSHGIFVFGFDRTNKPVAVYEIRGTGNSEFIYMKSLERNRITLLKEVLKDMINRVRQNEYTIKTKSDTLKASIQEVIPQATVSERDGIHTISILRRHINFAEENISISNKDRWQEL